MEAASEKSGLNVKIRPPRLEDAGLEDCALSPKSITEAFVKAATSVQSTAASLLKPSHDEEDADCVIDPSPDVGDRSDAPLGAALNRDGPSPCSILTGSASPPRCGVKAVSVDEEAKIDEFVGWNVSEEADKGSVEGLQGLDIEEKLKDRDGDDGGEEARERPVLAETCI